ncbi:MAG TPA: M23 family metallopeptidase [Nitrospiraceae bacterium]|nr:M23 family metallopeptidase [Nitrospiraceae bacterium]
MSQSNKSSDSYTIVIFRGSAAKPLRFSFPRSIVQRALILGVCLILADLALLSHYVIRTGEVWELQALREEMLSAREQTAAFSTAVDDLKRRLLTMKEVNQRLRVMLGIQEVKPPDLLNGRGGDETPILDGSKTISVTESVENRNRIETEQKSDENPQTSNSTIGPSQEKGLASHVKQELAWLDNEAAIQEQSLEELTAAAEKRSNRWAATPSVWPVKGWVTSGFGPRISPFTDKPAMHDGIDIGTAPNTPVHAPAAGRVTVVGFDPKMGNLVNLDHGYGIQTQYGHLSKALVKSGQRVKRGELIGLVGSTGLSTGPHLHYMVKVNSQAVNPQQYILD